MNKLLRGSMAFAIAGILTGCGLESPTDTDEDTTDDTEEVTEDTDTETETDTDQEAEVTLVYAEVNPLDSIVGQTGTAFKERVEELSDGAIEIDIQASGVLGSENDVLDSMLGGGGTIDMSRISAFALTPYGGEKSSLLSLPYTFESRDHFWNFATSDLADEFLMEPNENGSGIRGLFYGEEGFRHFFTVDPVESMDDLSGMKLRVSNDPVMNGLVEGLDASPTVVSFGELYSALQTGVVDGAEQPIANYSSNAFDEVAPNIILDGHTMGAIQVIIADAAWNELSEEHQDILMEAGEYASEFNREISEEHENEILEELRDSGVNVTDVEDLEPWREAVQGVIEDNTQENPDLYQQILDMQ